MTNENARLPIDEIDKAGQGITEADQANTTVAPELWACTYDSARLWVKWSARRQWPQFAANDDVWALSVASWWHGAVGRG